MSDTSSTETLQCAEESVTGKKKIQTAFPLHTFLYICKLISWISSSDPNGKKNSMDSKLRAETRESTVKED